MMHLTAPHGLEQYSGAAWGTRDVCQGPLELLLALEHDEPAKAILRVVFAQQYETRGDWPQWFMLEPYSAIQDRRVAWRHHRLAAEGAVRLCRGDRRLRLPRRADRLAARRQFREDRSCRSGRRPCRQADRDGAPALHPRHASRPLRQRRLERFAAAGRSRQARLDGQQLDGRAALSAASPLCRDPAPRRPRRRGQRSTTRSPRRCEKDFNRASRPRRRGRRLCHLQSERRAARTAAPSQRPDDRPLLLAAPYDPGDPRRAVHAGPGAARVEPHRRSICCFPTAPA